MHTPTRTPWSAAEDATLARLHPTHTAKAIAAALGRTASAVDNRIHKLGLKKPAGYANPGCFGKGIKPWNTGTRYQAGGRSAQTRFKPGQMPHNTKPVGSYRINKADGTLQQKIGTAKGSNSRRWRGVHELVWIAAHGPVPAGHVCVFKPGMKTVERDEITLDRIECITRAENMRRNSYHNLPAELAEIVQLRGVINRKINRLAKKEPHEHREHC